MITSFKTQNISLAEDLQDLMCQLNKKIITIASNKLKSEKFGFKYGVDTDQYFILTKYREILKLKATQHPCLKEYDLESVISVIKQYITSGVIQKFQKTDVDVPGIGGTCFTVNYSY